MRYRSLVLLLPSLLMPRLSSAAEPTVSLATSLVTPFFGAYYLEGKLRAAPSFAFVMNTSYLSLQHGDWKTHTGTVGFGADYYFRGTALRGWHVEGIGELAFSSWRHEPSTQVAPVVLGYTGIALLGYELICDAGPVVDVGAGIVALRFPSARVDAAARDPLTRVYPAVKVDVGWAF